MKKLAIEFEADLLSLRNLKELLYTQPTTDKVKNHQRQFMDKEFVDRYFCYN